MDSRTRQQVATALRTAAAKLSGALVNEHGLTEKCKARVNTGASMVRGFPRFSQCSNNAVFRSEDGTAYCATHGAAHGYTTPPKPEKSSWIVFYTSEDGKKSYSYKQATSERGAIQSMRRTFPEREIDGVVPYAGDAAFRQSPEFDKWKDWWL